MKLKFVYYILPTIIIPIKSWNGKNLNAVELGNVILIAENEMDDRNGLLTHELTHAKQFYRTFGLAWILSKVSKKYRLKYEIEAYVEQIKKQNLSIENNYFHIVRYADLLYKHYDLGLSQVDILATLIAQLEVSYKVKKK